MTESRQRTLAESHLERFVEMGLEKAKQREQQKGKQGSALPPPEVITKVHWEDVVHVDVGIAAFTLLGVTLTWLLQQRSGSSLSEQAAKGAADAQLPSPGKEEAASAVNGPGRAPKAMPDHRLCVGKAAPRPKEGVTDLFLGLAAGASAADCALVVWVDGERREVTYAQFAEQVKAMARQFMQLGVKTGDRVLLRIHRGLHQMIAVYGSMAAGAVFVPVDPDVPEAWLRYVLEDSSAVLLVEELGRAPLPDLGIKVVEAPADGRPLREVGAGEVPESADALPALKPEDWSVIFYTSGSTGKPKGVLHTHAQLQNAAYGIVEDANVTKKSRVLLRSPAIWSTYEWEAFPPLMVGATLVVAAPLGHTDPMYLARVLEEEQIHMIAITPKSLDLVLDAVEQAGYQLASLSDVASTGEQLPTTLANRFAALLPQARLHNGYNPTESAACTWYTVPPKGLDLRRYPTNVPAGLPQPGVSVYVMDADCPKELRELPEGEEGEIMFGGLLSEGYWNRTELTAEKFVSSPLGKLYHSGDKGKWEDGLLVTLGRIDRQVKIRGVRVEPEEVEAVLGAAWRDLRQKRGEGVTMGAGVACVASTGDQVELVAYVAPTATEEELAIIEKEVKSQLPVHYVPSRFQTIERLPALPNGKVDVKTLQRMATDLVSEGSLVVDSLGLARKAVKEALLDQEVVYRCYTVWALGVVAAHWYFPDILHPPRPLAAAGWVVAILQGVVWEVSTIGFMMVKGYADAAENVKQTRPAVRLGISDLVLLWAYILYGLMGCAWNILVESGPERVPWIGVTSSPRWFICVLLLTRVVLAVMQRVSANMPLVLELVMDVVAVAAVSFCLGLIDVCKVSWTPIWFRWLWSTALNPELGFQDSCPSAAHPGLGFVYCLIYIAGLHSRGVVKNLRGALPDALKGRCFALLCFGLYCIAGVTLAHWFPWSFSSYVVFGVERPGLQLLGIVAKVSGGIAMVGLLAIAAASLPFSARRTGEAAFGIYVFHKFFPLDHLVQLLTALQAFPALHLTAFLVTPALWMVLFGPLAMWILTLPVRLLARSSPAEKK